jgi:hypothetical protein
LRASERLDPPRLHILIAERQELEQRKRLRGFFEGSKVLQHRLGFAVL